MLTSERPVRKILGGLSAQYGSSVLQTQALLCSRCLFCVSMHESKYLITVRHPMEDIAPIKVKIMLTASRIMLILCCFSLSTVIFDWRNINPKKKKKYEVLN